MNWQDKPTTIKGNIGEDVIKQFLEEKDYIVYTTSTDGPHSFDLMFHQKGMKSKIIFGEVKTKDSMKWSYGDVTGFNTKQLNEYIELTQETNRDLLLFFVDDRLKQIYGAWLRTLINDKTWSKEIVDSRTNTPITLWNVSTMQHIKNI